MKIGVPKEIKADEYRVGLLQVGARLLVDQGHTVIVVRLIGNDVAEMESIGDLSGRITNAAVAEAFPDLAVSNVLC